MSQIIQTYILPNIGSILLFFVTLGLLAVTWRYARATKKMAQVMEDELSIKLKPLGEMKAENFRSKGYNLIFDLLCNNRGSFFIRIHSYKIKCWVGDFKDKAIYPVEKIADVFVIPGESETIEIELPLKDLYNKFAVVKNEKIPFSIELSVELFNAKNESFTGRVSFSRTFP